MSFECKIKIILKVDKIIRVRNENLFLSLLLISFYNLNILFLCVMLFKLIVMITIDFFLQQIHEYYFNNFI